MQFIADENIPASVITALTGAGHEVSRLDAGLPDEDICAEAARRGAVIITQDNDFGTLVFRDRMSVPGVLLIRMPEATPTEVATRVIDVLASTVLVLFGNIVVADADKIRVTELPATE